MGEDGAAGDLLAIDGGRPVVTGLPERGLIGAEERAAVLGVLDRAIAAGAAIEYGGPEEEAYCAEFAATLGGGYADAVNSGTAALYVALRALGVEPFTEVVVPAITDPGGIMPVPLLGCIPVVADTAPGSFNCGPEQVEAVMGPLTGAVIVAHVAGEPAPVEPIARLAERHGVPLIEDCAQAHGARIGGAPAGSFGTVSCFSTMWGKHHSTGGQGGVLFTRDPHLYRRIRGAADRGKPFGDTLPAGRNYLASLNFNQDELSAAIGRAQLGKLPAAVERRRAFVRALAARLAGVPSLQVPETLDGAEPSWWFLRLRYRSAGGWDKERFCAAVAAERRRAFVRALAARLAGVPSLQVPETLDGAEPSWWFLRLRYRSAGGWDKERFCAAVAAEGVPVNPTYAALPATYTWFRERRVFGARGGFPWTAAEYRGDPDRAFPCPNAHAAVADHLVVPVRESWGEAEAERIAAAFARVDRAARRTAGA